MYGELVTQVLQPWASCTSVTVQEKFICVSFMSVLCSVHKLRELLGAPKCMCKWFPSCLQYHWLARCNHVRTTSLIVLYFSLVMPSRWRCIVVHSPQYIHGATCDGLPPLESQQVFISSTLVIACTLYCFFLERLPKPLHCCAVSMHQKLQRFTEYHLS